MYCTHAIISRGLYTQIHVSSMTILYVYLHTDYGHTKAKSLIFGTQIQIPIPNKHLRCVYKVLLLQLLKNPAFIGKNTFLTIAKLLTGWTWNIILLYIKKP